MKQYSFRLNSLADLASLSLRSWATGSSAILVHIFSGWDTPDIMALVSQLKQILPEAVIVGSTSAGEILYGELSLNTTIISCMVFSMTKLQVETIDFNEQAVEKGVKQLLEQCHAKDEHIVGIELLIGHNDPKTYAFLDYLGNCPGRVPIFGGAAGRTPPNPSFVFFGETIIYDGVVAVLFQSEELHIQFWTSQGWCPLGPWFRITAMQSENIISHLDNKPAILVYQKYLGFEATDFANENLSFPLFLERSGHPMLRLPAQCTEDGAILLRADCRVGERVKLAYGNADEILNASTLTQKELCSFAPQAILLFNCMSRRFFLRDATHQELKPFQDTAPCFGYYTEGEVARAEDGDLSLLNMSLVSVCFREGCLLREVIRKNPVKTPVTKELTPTMKFLKHLTHFIAVSSAELEELATKDKLTSLYNRGQIESIIKKELLERRNFSAILLDLDDFKSINDTFGHDVGDRVLAWTAAVMKQNIRAGDSAGRWGGEEFLIILPKTPQYAAEKVAERIRTKLRQGFSLPNDRKITASMGLAEFSHTNDFRNVYRALDTALYQAKQKGKDCYCVADTVQL